MVLTTGPSTLWQVTCILKKVNGHEMNGRIWSSGLAIFLFLIGKLDQEESGGEFKCGKNHGRA